MDAVSHAQRNARRGQNAAERASSKQWINVDYVARVFQSSKATNTARLFLLAVAAHANDEGECWPSQAKLARWCGVSPRQVQRAEKACRDLGELEVVENGGPLNENDRHPNLYRITLPRRGTTHLTSHDERGATDMATRDDTSDVEAGSTPLIEQEVEQTPSRHLHLVDKNATRAEAVVSEFLAGSLSRIGAKKVDRRGWESEARAMLREDGRDPKEAIELIEWAHADVSFWQSRITSMRALRNNFDKLALRRASGRSTSPAPLLRPGDVAEGPYQL